MTKPRISVRLQALKSLQRQICRFDYEYEQVFDANDRKICSFDYETAPGLTPKTTKYM